MEAKGKENTATQLVTAMNLYSQRTDSTHSEVLAYTHILELCNRWKRVPDGLGRGLVSGIK